MNHTASVGEHVEGGPYHRVAGGAGGVGGCAEQRSATLNNGCRRYHCKATRNTTTQSAEEEPFIQRG